LQVLALFIIFLSVQEPSGNAVSFGVSNDVGDTIALSLSELTSSKLGVDPEDFTDEESVSSADTFDSIESVGDCSLSVDVGVQNTMDVLESGICVFNDQ